MEEEQKYFADMVQVIDFAIEREREAQQLYRSYIKLTQNVSLQQLLTFMVEMEQEHERKLRALKEGKDLNRAFSVTGRPNLKVTDFFIDLSFSPEMDYGDFLIMVIKKEGRAQQLYIQLQALAVDSELKQLFQALAYDEGKHKSWAQDRYDLEVLKEQ